MNPCQVRCTVIGAPSSEYSSVVAANVGSPAARKIAASIVVVDVFPLVPVTPNERMSSAHGAAAGTGLGSFTAEASHRSPAGRARREPAAAVVHVGRPVDPAAGRRGLEGRRLARPRGPAAPAARARRGRPEPRQRRRQAKNFSRSMCMPPPIPAPVATVPGPPAAVKASSCVCALGPRAQEREGDAGPPAHDHQHVAREPSTGGVRS